MKLADLMPHLPEHLPERCRMSAEPSVVTPNSAKLRVCKEVFRRLRNVRMSS